MLTLEDKQAIIINAHLEIMNTEIDTPDEDEIDIYDEYVKQVLKHQPTDAIEWILEWMYKKYCSMFIYQEPLSVFNVLEQLTEARGQLRALKGA